MGQVLSRWGNHRDVPGPLSAEKPDPSVTNVFDDRYSGDWSVCGGTSGKLRAFAIVPIVPYASGDNAFIDDDLSFSSDSISFNELALSSKEYSRLGHFTTKACNGDRGRHVISQRESGRS